jgi:putative colanic acid biosynthesis UDP-glucose lipid carrier transferase
MDLLNFASTSKLGLLEPMRRSESMAPPLLIRSSLSVALITVLQYLLPGLLIGLLLWGLSLYFDWPFDSFLAGLAAITWLLTALVFRPSQSYTPELRFNPARMITSVFLRWFALAIALMAIGYLSGLSENYPRRIVLPWALISPFIAAGTLLGLQLVLRQVALTRQNQRSAVIVGVNMSSLSLARKLTHHPEFCSRIVGFFDDRNMDRLGPFDDFKVIGRLNLLADFVRREKVDIIFVSLPIQHADRMLNLLDDLQDTTASIYYVPDLFVFDLIQSRTSEIEGIPIVAMCETPFHGYRGVSKRMTDIGLTLLLMIPAIPIMLVIALLVKLDSKGPALYRQRRYGLDGQEITVYKFRSMRVTEAGAEIIQATRDDPRITRLGRFLRRYSLDELPQLINVLQGRMSLVGPRPHAVAHNETYRKLIKGYMLRHKVLPGITGLAQVNGFRGETQDLSQMQARVAYDIDYLRHWSPSLDLRILLMTVRHLLGNPNAY